MTRQFLKLQQANIMAEFAIAIVAVVLLIFGGVELARMYHAQQVLSQAAAEGARFAAIYGGADSVVQDRIEQQLANGGLDPAQVTVEIFAGDWQEPVTVRLSMPFHLRAPLLDLNYTLGAQHTAQREKY